MNVLFALEKNMYSVLLVLSVLFMTMGRFILENVPLALEKNVYYVFLGVKCSIM